MCLARHGGEHDQVSSVFNIKETSDFKSSINWPTGFLELCKSERIGIIPPEFQNMKAQAGDDPNHIYPLRDVDAQFQVKHKRLLKKSFFSQTRSWANKSKILSAGLSGSKQECF